MRIDQLIGRILCAALAVVAGLIGAVLGSAHPIASALVSGIAGSLIAGVTMVVCIATLPHHVFGVSISIPKPMMITIITNDTFIV